MNKIVIVLLSIMFFSFKVKQQMIANTERKLKQEDVQTLVNNAKIGKIKSVVLKKILPKIITQNLNIITLYKVNNIKVFFVNSLSDSLKMASVVSLKNDSIINEIYNLVITKKELLKEKKVTKYFNELVLNKVGETIYINQLTFDAFLGDTLSIAPKIQILKNHNTKEIKITSNSIIVSNHTNHISVDTK